MLFVDFSSAFNTIIPFKLFDKLKQLNFVESINLWILDFLLNRPQVVKIGNNISSTLVLNTGAPQGCVLSPYLYSLYTHDCVSTHDSIVLLKFADDTTIEGLIENSNEIPYRNQVDKLVSWCSENNLELNVSKTKEMVIDFRRSKPEPEPLVINGKHVEIVDCFKFLGTTIAHNLKWDKNIASIIKKAQQRLYFLRQLNKFGICKEVMVQFYRAVIESQLTFSMSVWFGGISQEDKAKLNKIVVTASKVIGTDLPCLDMIYRQRVINRATLIANDATHPAHSIFQLLPSGRRYRSLKANTVRFSNSFFPRAVHLLSYRNF